MIGIGIKVDLRQAQRALGDLAGKQIPFATALGLTMLAEGVQMAELDEVKRDFEKTTAFTEKAFGKTPANKTKLVATVFIKNKSSRDASKETGGQNGYLEPYVVGGARSLGTKKGMLVPVAARTNQYRNLPKGALARLKADPTVFIGPVKTKYGMINGVWQRTPASNARGRGKRAKPATKAHLTLLIEFEDTTAVPHRFDFYGRARSYVDRWAQPVLEQALKRAIASAKPGKR